MICVQLSIVFHLNYFLFTLIILKLNVHTQFNNIFYVKIAFSKRLKPLLYCFNSCTKNYYLTIMALLNDTVMTTEPLTEKSQYNTQLCGKLSELSLDNKTIESKPLNEQNSDTVDDLVAK